MQDRITFTKNIDCNDISHIVKEYFDEIMALYDLVGTYNNFSIKSDTCSTPFILFNLTFESEVDSIQILNVVNGTEIRKYGKIFKCDVQLNSNVLIVTIKE